jgi:hypothetical protein
MITHTYSVIRYTNAYNYAWTLTAGETFGIRCSCGIESGQTHRTIASAHAEPLHYYATDSRRIVPKATYDGNVIVRDYR